MTKELFEHKKLKTMELKKHVAVIHSSGKISLLQRKIANALLFHSYEHLMTQEEHTIHLSVLTKLIGYDSHDHKKIKQALMNLLATVIEWNIVDGEKIDKEGIWNASSVIADASIQGAICTYSYSNKMRKLLYHPSVYGRVSLEVQARFQSSYGLALYENCNRYQDIGQTPLFELDKFRRLMGVEDEKYKIFRDFKTRVLDKAVEEVNKYSPLKVEAILKKQNRQVIAIQFLISRESIKSASKIVSIENTTELSSRLKNQYGLSQKQAQELIKNHDEPYIVEKINIIESSASYHAGKIKNLGKYLLCALEEDYQPIKASVMKQHMPKERTRLNDNQITQYQQYTRKAILEKFSELHHDEQHRLKETFSINMRHTLYAKLYEAHGFSNILVEDQWVKFLMENWGRGVSCVLSQEIWLAHAQVISV